MKILVINGNPKQGGFTAGVLDIVSSYLAAQDADADVLRLADVRIEDCIGCFQCLKTGKCVLDDDMGEIIQKIVEAEAYVVGSPVRNGLVTACYKRFIERITYLLGFALQIEDKYTLAISSVGLAGGKAVSRKLVGLQDVFHTHLSAYLFFRTGIPTKIQPEDVREKLERAADKLLSDVKSRRTRGLLDRLSRRIDRLVVRKLMLARSPETYAYVIERWKEKGYV